MRGTHSERRGPHDRPVYTGAARTTVAGEQGEPAAALSTGLAEPRWRRRAPVTAAGPANPALPFPARGRHRGEAGPRRGGRRPPPAPRWFVPRGRDWPSA